MTRPVSALACHASRLELDGWGVLWRLGILLPMWLSAGGGLPLSLSVTTCSSHDRLHGVPLEQMLLGSPHHCEAHGLAGLPSSEAPLHHTLPSQS